MPTDYFDRLNRCVDAWRQVKSEPRYTQASERLQEWYSDTLMFLEELLLLRGILDLDKSAHILDEEAGTRAISEAQSILEIDRE